MPILEALGQWIDSFGKDIQVEYNKDIFGSSVFLVGQPGTGKTYRAAQLGLKAGFDSGLPVVMHGLNGDMEKFYHAALATAKKKKLKAKVEFLRDKDRVKIINEEGTGTIEGYLRYLARKALRGHLDSPEQIWVIDEAGALRLNDEDFWNVARRFRNYGILCYATGHRMVDLPPSARETLRAVIPFTSYEGIVEIFGQKYNSIDFTKPGEKDVKYITSLNRKVEVWDSDEDPPDILIAPSKPTRVKELEF